MRDKVVIITGASSGIGKALAGEAAKRGAKLVLAARRQEKLQQLAEDLEAQGTEVLIAKTDVSIEADCQAMVEAALDRFGQIDVLVNNAGISMRAAFQDMDLGVMRRLMDVNFFGTVSCTRFALPHILETKGSVVGVSSIAGHRGLPGRTAYSSSKFAMQGFLEALRTEVMHQGVHVLVACPGFTASEIRSKALLADGSQQGASPRDEGKMMTAEEVSSYICDAIQKRKRDLVLTTQGKMTVMLNKLFPSMMDKMVYNHMKKEADSPF